MKIITANNLRLKQTNTVFSFLLLNIDFIEDTNFFN